MSMHTAQMCVLSHLRWIEFQRNDLLLVTAAPDADAVPHPTHLHAMKIVRAYVRCYLGIALPAHHKLN